MALTQRKRHSPKASLLVLLLAMVLVIRLTSGSFVSVYRFRATPDKEMYSDIGGNLTLRWRYFKTNQKLLFTRKEEQRNREFLFGEWSFPGYVSNKILLVRGSAVTKRKSYESKVDYEGNLSNECSNCSAEITLFNLTRADFKTYGVYIFIYPYVHPLQSTLRVVRRVPARIKSWVKYVSVQEGNTTSITCRAEGMPRPLVEIQKDNKTVAKGTSGSALLIVVDVTPEQGGEYFCVVFPKDKTQSVIRDGMKMEVLSSRKMLEMEPTNVRRVRTVSSSAKWTKALYTAVLLCTYLVTGAHFV